MTEPYTPTEIMTVVAARALKNDDVVFVGIGAPSAAWEAPVRSPRP